MSVLIAARLKCWPLCFWTVKLSFISGVFSSSKCFILLLLLFLLVLKLLANSSLRPLDLEGQKKETYFQAISGLSIEFVMNKLLNWCFSLKCFYACADSCIVKKNNLRKSQKNEVRQ